VALGNLSAIGSRIQGKMCQGKEMTMRRASSARWERREDEAYVCTEVSSTCQVAGAESCMWLEMAESEANVSVTFLGTWPTFFSLFLDCYVLI